ncbi:MAG: signal peptide peptidase SppA [Bacteroidales bacterium]|nr:signal peptide peptidase SppA [Bacteroidales bacterium]
MKDFLKFTLATITGIILSTILLFFLGTIVVFGIISSADTEVILKDNSILRLKLSGELEDRVLTDNTWQSLLGKEQNDYGLEDVLHAIKKAKEEDKIKGIYIDAGSLNTYFGSLWEIREALTDFKESGKFIISYADFYTQGLYYLSSVSDKVILNPQGGVNWSGLSSNPIYYKNLLNKLGIEMQVFKVGTYKSAVEPFISDEMSEENREQLTALLGNTWNNLLTSVSRDRQISIDSLNLLANQMPQLQPAETILASNLVDTLLYKTEVDALLKEELDIDADKKLNFIGINQMAKVRESTPKDKSGNLLAVYYASGDIIDNEPSFSLQSTNYIIGSKVVKDLKKLEENKHIKAVVFRVNSPGGSAYASEQIWKAIKDLKKKKPVIVSMGDYAASGGYYISSAADTILATPTTLTGSIGIFGMYPNTEELTKKIGINVGSVKTNRFSDFGLIGRGLNKEEQALLQLNVNRGYDLFLARCAEGRKTTPEEIHKIAEGRVWTGEMAKELNLVDGIGGLELAVKLAAEKAELDSYTVTSYPAKESMFNLLLKSTNSSVLKTIQDKEILFHFFNPIHLLNSLNEGSYIQARLPFDLNIQ